MTGSPSPGAEELLTGEARRIGTGEIIIMVVRMVVRMLLGFAVIVAILALVPEQPEASLIIPVAIAVGAIVGYAFFFAHQLRGVYKARYPMLRAIEALILVAAMFLAIFAMIYVMISATDPNSFTEELDPFNAYYFALTVLATVGFGDITPVTTAARSVAMAQMALDIAFIAVLIRIMGGAARRTIHDRKQRTDLGASEGNQ